MYSEFCVGFKFCFVLLQGNELNFIPDISLGDIKNYTEDNEICCFIAKIVDFVYLAPIHHKDKYHALCILLKGSIFYLLGKLVYS